MADLSPPRDAALLVGRERELALLRQSLDAARAGRGGLVLLSGEAGIGKTALAEALCREAQAHGAFVFTGRCYDLTATPPYGPWLELFGGAPTAPGLPPVPAPFSSRWGGLGSNVSQAALFDRARQYLAAVAAVRPTVLLLEDLHWADPASLDLLRFLARSLHGSPLLLLATYRADELARQHPLHTLLPLLEREAAPTRLALRPLAGEAVRSLIAARYALTETEAERLAGYLDARAEGNPLFVVQLLRALEDEGILAEGARGWRLGELDRLGVPLPLLEVIDARIARLPEDVQRLLAVAAVIGQEVPLALWTAVAQTDEGAVIAALEQAMATRLMDASADGETAHFVHALVREALYAGILPPRRRRWHRAVGDILATVPAVDPDVVAYHFRQAGDARAVEWLLRAAERALRAAARLTAADRYERALAAMEAAGADAGARGWLLYRLMLLRRFVDHRQGLAHFARVALLADEAGDRALAACGRFSEGLFRCSLNEFQRGLEMLLESRDALAALTPAACARIPDASFLTITPGPYMEQQLVLWLAHAGRYAEAEAIFRSLGPGPADPACEDHYGMTAMNGAAYISTVLGRPDEARERFAATRAASRAARIDYQVGLNTVSELVSVVLPYFADRRAEWRPLIEEAGAAFERASEVQARVAPRLAELPSLYLDGRWQEARTVAEANFAIGTSWAFKSVSARILGPLARRQGDPGRAWRLIDAALPTGTATAPGTVHYLTAVAMQALGAALALDAGDLPLTRAWLEAHDRWLEWSGAVLGQSERHALWARYHRQAGDPGEAWAHAERAVAHACAPRQPLALLAAHRLLGELATDASRCAQAATHLDAARALADACAAPYERALILLARAERDAAVGDRAAAAARLDEAQATCTRLGAELARARADALAARLLGPAAAAPAYPAGLSAREVEVLRLVAAGYTNRTIAAILSLGERTVQTHVRSILTKTDTPNRTAAAVFARDHGLA